MSRSLKSTDKDKAAKHSTPPSNRTVSPDGMAQADPKYRIARLIGRARSVLWDAADKALAPFDLTTSQWMVIVNLYGREGVTSSDICKAISYDPGAMTRLIDRLVKKYLVCRVRESHDRRLVTLKLTDTALNLYPKLMTAIVKDIDAIFSDFSDAEEQQLALFLDRIVD